MPKSKHTEQPTNADHHKPTAKPGEQVVLDPEALFALLSSAIDQISVREYPLWVYLPHSFSASTLLTIRSTEGVAAVLVVGQLPDELSEQKGFYSHPATDAPLPEGLPPGHTMLSLHPQGLPLDLRRATSAGLTQLLYRHGFHWKRASLTGSQFQKKYERFRSMLPQSLKHKLPPSDLLSSALPGWSGRMRNTVRNILKQSTSSENNHIPNRILFCNATLRNGGAERQLIYTLRGMHDRGHKDLHLLCHRLNDHPAHSFHLESVRSLGIPVRQLQHEDNFICKPNHGDICFQLNERLKGLPPHIAGDTLRYSLEIAQLRPSVLHVWLDALPVALAGLIIGVPRVIISTRSLSLAKHAKTYLPSLPVRTQSRLPFDPTLKPIYQALLEHPNFRLCNNSLAGSLDYATWLETTKEQVDVVYNGIDLEHWKPSPKKEISRQKKEWGIPENRPIVGSLFRMTSTKDPSLWLETAARVSRAFPDVIFVVFGDGMEHEAMRRKAESLGISEKLFMPGLTHEVPTAISMFNVLLLTSLIESTPNVLIEAQLLGVPVVTTMVGGTPETILHGTSGWLVKERSPAQLADRVGYCLQDHDWRALAKQASPVFIQDRFTLDAMLNKTMDLYNLNSGVRHE